jgi:hypothetical protein
LWGMYFIEPSFFWQGFPITYSIFGYRGGYALVVLGL